MKRLLTGSSTQIGLILVGLIVVFTLLEFESFFAVNNARNIATDAAVLLVLAVGATYVIVTAGIDLSVGAVLVFSGVVAAKLMNELGGESTGVLLAGLAAALASGFAWGLLNGFLVTKANIPSFIVTLGTLLIWRSVLLRVTEGFPVAVPQDETIFRIFSYRIEEGFFRGYQVSILWFLGVLVILSFVLLRTRFGNWTFASGGNERSARSMGVPVDRVWIILFVVTALCACLTGLIQVGRFNTVEATRGQLLELQAIAAAVIGGARLNGGYGSVLGAALGAAMIAMIQQGLVLSGIASYWLNFAVGLLIIAAVIVNQQLGRSRPQI
jgi:ribose/xylose/arabinose/galactoside ABC-type transport system permease subunit